MNLVVINKSLGEIDWISANRYKFGSDVIFINYRCNNDEIKKFSPNFYSSEIEMLHNCDDYLYNFILVKKIDDILDKGSTFIFNKTKSHLIQKLFDLSLVYIKRCIAYILVKSKSSDWPHANVGVETIFHENNDRNTVFLEIVKLVYRQNRVVFFPHHFGIAFPKNLLTKTIHKLSGSFTVWVNRPSESDGMHYKYIEIQKPKPRKINGDDKVVLIMTRQCSLDYGFDYEDAYVRLNSVLARLQEKYQSKFYIKHHPRDKFNPTWKKLEEVYSLNVLESSVLDFCSNNNVTCYHLYTTVIEPLNSLGVKCIDVSPYKRNPMFIPSIKENMNYYLNKGITKLYDENETV